MTHACLIVRAMLAASFAAAIGGCGGGPAAQGNGPEPLPANDNTAPAAAVDDAPPAAAVDDAPPAAAIDDAPPAAAIDDAPPAVVIDIAPPAVVIDEAPPAVAGRHDDMPPVSVNRAPTISGAPGGGIEVGQRYEFLPEVSDPDGDDLSFNIENAPAWAEFDPSTGRLSGTPQATDIGEYPDIHLSVSDGVAIATLTSFRIVVEEPPVINSPPSISGLAPGSVVAGEVYEFAPSAFDPNGDLLAFAIVGQPTWSVFDAESGLLSGIPAIADIGTHGGIAITVSDGSAGTTLGPFQIEVLAPNSLPVITGTPAAKVVKRETYNFVPVASDADGDVLTFGIDGQPSWAVFDSNTGALTGSPSASDAGIYGNITITVTDGMDVATLGPFYIEVLSVGPRSAELSWTPPTENDDGSALTDLSGYVIYWGTTDGKYSNSVVLDNPGLTAYVVENLAPGRTYYFTLTAFNESGRESQRSNQVSKLVAGDD